MDIDNQPSPVAPAAQNEGETSQTIEVAAIAQGLKVRAKTSRTTIEEYAKAMADRKAKFPPIVVYRDEPDDKGAPRYLLCDGAHRLAAVVKNGGTTIDAIVREGSKRDCMIAAVQSAAEFGLRFSTKDRQHQIGLFIEQFPKMKDREIGRAIGCDGKTVGAQRERMAAAAAAAEIPQAAEPTDPDDRMAERLTKQIEKAITCWPSNRREALRALLTQWSDALAPAEVQP